MTDDQITALLAVKILGWRVCRDRFIKPCRSWIPKWRFQPLVRLEDAFDLLDKVGGTYTLAVDVCSAFTAKIRVGDRIGEASGEPKARTITLAICAALGIGVALGGRN